MKSIFVRLSIIIIGIISVIPFAFSSKLLTQKTFNEYMEISGLEKQYDQMIEIFVSDFQKGMVQGFTNSVKDKEIPNDIRRELTIIVSQSSENLKFDLEHFYRNEIKFKDMINNVYYPVHQKLFTEQEMIEIINFYQSPIGKKLSKLTPKIMTECSTIFNRVYGAKVQEAGIEIFKAESESLRENFESLKKPHGIK